MAVLARSDGVRDVRSAAMETVRRTSPTWLLSCTGMTAWQNSTGSPCPPRDGHAGSPADGRIDFKIVDQSFGAGKPHPQTPTGGIAVCHRQGDVRNAGTVVLKSQAQPLPSSINENLVV